MEVPKQEETVHYFDKCMCCLEEGDLRDAWAQYLNESGDIEIYGEMLNECFSLNAEPTLGYVEQICDGCVERLRFSLNFRREVVASREVLEQLKETVQEVVSENVVVKTEPEQEETEEPERITGDLQEEDAAMSEDSQAVEYLTCVEEGESQDEATVTIEYLEDDDEELQEEDSQPVEYLSGVEEGESQGEATVTIEYLEDDDEAATAIKKQSRRPKKLAYKQYSNTDLELAMNAVFDEEMSISEAAGAYNIPAKTLRANVRKRERGVDGDGADSEAQNEHKNFYKEIRTILTYTNATPYKTKVGRFFCAYCGTQGQPFFNVDELRTHTRTAHAIERIKNVDVIMRPVYLNEVLKLDIFKLQCTVCMTDINDWNSMFDHLKEKHEVDFEHAQNRVIPFVLDSSCACALCDKSFSHYHQLDVHMNCHYNNYICGECGDSFLAESRLKKHSEIHSTGRFPCNECGKEFTLEKYRKKHHDFVHLKEHKFRCVYCLEIFNSAYLRHKHIEEKHGEAVRTYECEHCHMTFTWRPYYLKHKRLNHSLKYQCKLCNKQFSQKHEIKNHLEWHKGTGYTCNMCNKKFSSKNYLQKHMEACFAVKTAQQAQSRVRNSVKTANAKS